MLAKRGDLYFYTVDPSDAVVLETGQDETRTLGSLKTGDYLVVLSGELDWNNTASVSDPPYSLTYEARLTLTLGTATVLTLVASSQQYYQGQVNYRRGFVGQASFMAASADELSLTVSRTGEGGSANAPEMSFVDLKVSVQAASIQTDTII